MVGSLFSKMLANAFVLVRVPQRNRANKRIYTHTHTHTHTHTYIYTHSIYIVLVHAIMEAEKSQDLQSVCWRPRKADSSSSSKAIRHKTQKNQCFSPRSKDQKRPTSQLNSQAFFLSFFVLFRSSVDWTRSTHIREGNVLYSVY